MISFNGLTLGCDDEHDCASRGFEEQNFANPTGLVSTRILEMTFCLEQTRFPSGHAERLPRTPHYWRRLQTQQNQSSGQYRYILNSKSPRQVKKHPDKCWSMSLATHLHQLYQFVFILKRCTVIQKSNSCIILIGGKHYFKSRSYQHYQQYFIVINFWMKGINQNWISIFK